MSIVERYRKVRVPALSGLEQVWARLEAAERRLAARTAQQVAAGQQLLHDPEVRLAMGPEQEAEAYERLNELEASLGLPPTPYVDVPKQEFAKQIHAGQVRVAERALPAGERETLLDDLADATITRFGTTRVARYMVDQRNQQTLARAAMSRGQGKSEPEATEPPMGAGQWVRSLIEPYAPPAVEAPDQAPQPGGPVRSVGPHRQPEPITATEPAVPAVAPTPGGHSVAAPPRPTGVAMSTAAGSTTGKSLVTSRAPRARPATTAGQISQLGLAKAATPAGAPAPKDAAGSYPSMRAIPSRSRLAEGIGAALRAGYSHDEILDHLVSGGWGPSDTKRNRKPLKELLPPDAILGAYPRESVEPAREKFGAKVVVEHIRQTAPQRPGDLFGGLAPNSVRQDTVDLLLLHPGWKYEDYQQEITRRHGGLTVEALPDLWEWAHEYVKRPMRNPSLMDYGDAWKFSDGKDGRRTWARDALVADPSLMMGYDRFRELYRRKYGDKALEDTPDENLRNLWRLSSDMTRVRLGGALRGEVTQEARNPRAGASVRRFGRAVVGGVKLGTRDLMEEITAKISPGVAASRDVQAQSARRDEAIQRYVQGGPEEPLAGPAGTFVAESAGGSARVLTPEVMKTALTYMAGGPVTEVISEAGPVMKAMDLAIKKMGPYGAKLLANALIEAPVNATIWNLTAGETDPKAILHDWAAFAVTGAVPSMARAKEFSTWTKTEAGQVFMEEYGPAAAMGRTPAGTAEERARVKEGWTRPPEVSDATWGKGRKAAKAARGLQRQVNRAGREAASVVPGAEYRPGPAKLPRRLAEKGEKAAKDDPTVDPVAAVTAAKDLGRGVIIAKRWEDLIPIAQRLEQQGFRLKARVDPAHPWNKTGYLGIHYTKQANGLSMEIQLSTPEHWSLKQKGESAYRLDRSAEWEKMTPEEREAAYAKAKVTPQDWAALGAKIPEPVKRWMHEHSVE
jgi:hypothetical protein